MDVNFKLFPSQLKVLKSQQDVTLLLAGRGVGKSTIACHWVLDKIVNESHVMGFIGTPSHAQTNELMNKLVNLLSSLNFKYVIGKRPKWDSSLTDHRQILSIKAPNGKLSQIRYGSLENYESHRGISIGWLLLDEAALIREIAYREVLLPALRGYGGDHNYSQLLLTTPKGISNWVSELIDMGNVNIIRAPSSENFIEFTDDKLEQFKGMMSNRQYRQEILGEVLNVSDLSMFHAFNKSHLLKQLPIDKSLRLAIASDQNVAPLTSIILLFNDDKVYVVDEIYLESGTVGDLANEFIKRKYLKNVPIFLYGDRSGNNRNLISDDSFYQQLIKRCANNGIKLIDHTLNSNPNVFDSAELVNKWFEDNKLNIISNCKWLITDLEKAVYKKGELTTDKKAYDPHMADSLRYFFWREFGTRTTFTKLSKYGN